MLRERVIGSNRFWFFENAQIFYFLQHFLAVWCGGGGGGDEVVVQGLYEPQNENLAQLKQAVQTTSRASTLLCVEFDRTSIIDFVSLIVYTPKGNILSQSSFEPEEEEEAGGRLVEVNDDEIR